MEITKEILDLLKDEPSNIRDYPGAPLEIQMMCVKAEPMSLFFMVNPHPEVILEAYRGEYTLIGENPNPTEEQQVAAAQGCFMTYLYLKNPCRAAALIILETYGTYFERLVQIQSDTGSTFAAAKLPLIEDAEIQAAALSNITGLRLYQKQPELFNHALLTEKYPNLISTVHTLLALGFDSQEVEEIRTELKLAKEANRVGELLSLPVPADISI